MFPKTTNLRFGSFSNPERNDSGMMLSRTYQAPSTDGYRFGFQGQEGDDEVSGTGNSYTAEFWQYDSRLGRWMSVDAKAKAFQSNYVFARNCPITWIDPDGNDDYFYDRSTNTWSVERTSQPHRFYHQIWLPVSVNENGEPSILETPVTTPMNANDVAEHLYQNNKLFKDVIHNAKSTEEQIQILSTRIKRANKDGVKVMIGTVAVPLVIIAAAEVGPAVYATEASKTFLVNAGINAASQTVTARGDTSLIGV